MQSHVRRAIFRALVTESRRALATRGRVGSAVWAAAVDEGYPTRGEVHKPEGGEVGRQSSMLFLSLPRPPPLMLDRPPLLRPPSSTTTTNSAADCRPRRRRPISWSTSSSPFAIRSVLRCRSVSTLANALIQVHLSLRRRWCIDPVSRLYSLSYATLLTRPSSAAFARCICFYLG